MAAQLPGLISRHRFDFVAVNGENAAGGDPGPFTAMGIYLGIKAAVAHAETEVGSIDILVNNAGVSTTQRIQDVSEEDFDYVFDKGGDYLFLYARSHGLHAALGGQGGQGR